MGNLLYLALRLVLGALTAAVCVALLSTLSPVGGFQGLVFLFVLFFLGGGHGLVLPSLRMGVRLADSRRIRMAPGQSGLTGLLSISAMPDCQIPAVPSSWEGLGSDPGPASYQLGPFAHPGSGGV